MSSSHAAAFAALSLLAVAMPAQSVPAADSTPAPVGERFVDGESVALAQRHWSGHLQFQDVYCVDFPDPERAVMRVTGVMNQGAVAMARVEYADGLLAYVVASTLPPGRSIAQEHAAQLALARDGHAKLDAGFEYDATDSAFGPVVARHLRNVAPERDRSLFPVELEFYDSARTLTFAESRVFARGPDRFEVAALGFTGEDATVETEAGVHGTVAAVAERLQASLQRCTAGLPLRTP
jgi:hypothetical protein